MARSRKQAWLRDELILALDLYLREGQNPSRDSVEALSKLLRELPIERDLAADARFRNASGVQLKLHNFAAIDPDIPGEGMTHGGRGDQEVWDEFSDNPKTLQQASKAIRANVQRPEPGASGADDDLISEAPEGALLTRLHRTRERSAKLARSKRSRVLRDRGRLACEGCGFDFARTYGERGDGFIECHHMKPVSTLRPNERIRLEDLALVCSNCHRMIHVRSPWLTMDELRGLTDPGPGSDIP